METTMYHDSKVVPFLRPLTSRDWRVIEVAREDGPWTLNPDGLANWIGRLVGLQGESSLANASLEALRRFSVRAWYWDLIRTKDVKALLRAGYSKTHVRQILSHVAESRGFTPSVQEDFA
jgi:hypothetical protein